MRRRRATVTAPAPAATMTPEAANSAHAFTAITSETLTKAAPELHPKGGAAGRGVHGSALGSAHRQQIEVFPHPRTGVPLVVPDRTT
ncbi:hypothetical protein AB0N93_32285 [Streptomyces sp. NPDC091267]|uniref:hypothetical protein n=1 Tax=unclassified Streptomyces TaxID=2593676 RepID=UPI003412E993